MSRWTMLSKETHTTLSKGLHGRSFITNKSTYWYHTIKGLNHTITINQNIRAKTGTRRTNVTIRCARNDVKNKINFGIKSYYGIMRRFYRYIIRKLNVKVPKQNIYMH